EQVCVQANLVRVSIEDEKMTVAGERSHGSTVCGNSKRNIRSCVHASQDRRLTDHVRYGRRGDIEQQMNIARAAEEPKMASLVDEEIRGVELVELITLRF